VNLTTDLNLLRSFDIIYFIIYFVDLFIFLVVNTLISHILAINYVHYPNSH
jgi:hypothetical protein